MNIDELLKEIEGAIERAMEHDKKEGFPYANVHLSVLKDLLEQLGRLKGL